MSSERRPAPDDLVARRAEVEMSLRALPAAAGVAVELRTMAGVPVEVLTPDGPRRRAKLLHFHGGALRLGSARGFRFFSSHLAATLQATVLSVDYSLAPESPFPAALEEAVLVLRSIAAGDDHEPVVLIGDSAGGNLAAALLLQTRETPVQAPVAMVLLSPWLDLRVVADSYEANADTDLAFSRESATEASVLYRQGHRATDPLVSPLLGDWTGQPPILVQASDSEVLIDDAASFARAARDAGVDVTFSPYPQLGHVWHYDTSAEPSRRALAEVADFLDRVIGPVPS